MYSRWSAGREPIRDVQAFSRSTREDTGLSPNTDSLRYGARALSRQSLSSRRVSFSKIERVLSSRSRLEMQPWQNQCRVGTKFVRSGPLASFADRSSVSQLSDVRSSWCGDPGSSRKSATT